MRRRGVGVSAAIKNQSTQEKFKEKGSELASEQLRLLSQQFDQFRTHLETFAQKHRDDIRKNPVFRKQFQDMCAAIGVDPLASSKGFWAEKLGFGDFYYELGVQIVEVCLATNHLNGGMMTLDELKTRLVRSRSKTRKDDIQTDDLLKAIEKLRILGSGFKVLPMGAGKYMVQSVPAELNLDHTKVIEAANKHGFVTVPQVCSLFRWETARASEVLEHMVQEGFCWIDLQAADREAQYWFPGFFSQDRI